MLRAVYDALVLLLVSLEYLEWVLYEKAYLKKDLRDPRLAPTAVQLCPLLPTQPLQPPTKALTSQQKRVQQCQQLLYSWNERSLFLGCQGDARVSFQSAWGYWLRLRNAL